MQTTLSAQDYRNAIPKVYDSCLGPILFQPFAAEMARHIPPLPGHGATVLEMACGTGQLTSKLCEELPVGAKLVALDLSESMLAHAKLALCEAKQVEWLKGDIADLMCEDGCFDAVFCQFGTMFCEDRPKVFSEAYRVLKLGGRFVFNVWDSLEHNDLARTAESVVARTLPPGSPSFFAKPYGFHNHREIRDLLFKAGFKGVEIETVHKPCIAPSARQAAVGLIQGTPNVVALAEAGIEDPEPIVDLLAAEIARQWGDNPVRCKMQAILVTTHRS